MNKLRVFFNNILPATFVDSYTYIEQIRILKNKLNETIEVVNELSSIVNQLQGGDSNE